MNTAEGLFYSSFQNVFCKGNPRACTLTDGQSDLKGMELKVQDQGTQLIKKGLRKGKNKQVLLNCKVR